MIKSVSDSYKSDFSHICNCMSNVGIKEAQQLEIFRLLSGILYLGNVTFIEDAYTNTVQSVSTDGKPFLQTACNLLGLDENAVVDILTKQLMVVNGTGIVKDQTMIQVLHNSVTLVALVCIMIYT